MNKRNKDLLLILLSSLTSILFFKLLEPKDKKDIEQMGGGFQEATALKQSQFICHVSELECIKEITTAFSPKKNRGKTLLILGNSQLGAINQMKDGDISYAGIVANNLNAYGYATRSIWMPNASLLEFEMLYQAISACGSEPDFLALPVFLDDTRETSVREDIKTISSRLCANAGEGVNELSFPSDTSTKHSTKSLSIVLSKKIIDNTPVLSTLSSLKSKFRLQLYFLRNTIFGITASSKRKMIPSGYKLNISKLQRIINRRHLSDAKTLVYVPPLLYSLTQPSMIPYIKDEYNSFKMELSSKCKESNCYFLNLEGLIPDNEWGTKQSTNLGNEKEELDFMHFNGLGHKRLAKRLILEFKAYFKL